MMELGEIIKALIEIGYVQFFGWTLTAIAITSIMVLWLNKNMEGDDD